MRRILKNLLKTSLAFFEINTSVDLNLTSDYSTKLGEERHSALIKIDVPEYQSDY
jgi:hypothetical protein